jgi:hypothetical protein
VSPEEAEIGRAVAYRAHPGATPEPGRIVSIRTIDTGMVHVAYRGDWNAKATRLEDLEMREP